MSRTANTTTGLRPFSHTGYEILDDDLASRGEVVIWSVSPLTARLGDSYLIERSGRTYEAVVAELELFRGGWSARCQAQPLLED